MISSLPGKALRALVYIVRLAEIQRMLGECLLISSLPGKALRTLVDTVRLAERFNMRSHSGFNFNFNFKKSSLCLVIEFDQLGSILCR